MHVRNVAADTTRLTCCDFIPILPFMYCLDPSSSLTACVQLAYGCHSLISLLRVLTCALYKTT